MALPKIDTPIYEIDLPLSKQHIRFRPFLVKEQRNLMMALEANDAETVEMNIKQVLNNCTLTEGVDIEKLPIVDVEYYFLNLRAKSVGEVIDSKYRCNNIVEGKDCGNIMEKPINLLSVNVDSTDQVSPEIQLTDKLSVKMKYPEFSIIKDSIHLDNDTEIVLNDINASSNRHQLLMKNTNFFWPDGIHPNILGHQIIFDFIKPQIPELVE